MTKECELLRRALDALHFDLSAKESAKVAEEIRAFLAAEPEAEPVAWTSDFELKELASNGYGYFSEPGDPRNNIPLYLHPPRPSPARKPMTKEEIHEGTSWFGDYAEGFKAGVRFAEKHHGIGEDDE